MKHAVAIIFAAMGWCMSSYADVLSALAAKESMAGRFTQRVISPEGRPLEISAGRFMLLRPDSLKWQIEEPDRQTLLSSGSQLTQIDWDLEVVVARDISPEERGAFQWLLAPREQLLAAFDIDPSETGLMLSPKQAGGAFQRIEITQEEDGIWRLVVWDLSDQRLDFTLNEEPGIVVKSADFLVPATPF